MYYVIKTQLHLIDLKKYFVLILNFESLYKKKYIYIFILSSLYFQLLQGLLLRKLILHF